MKESTLKKWKRDALQDIYESQSEKSGSYVPLMRRHAKRVIELIEIIEYNEYVRPISLDDSKTA
uniref:Uncharacterized protein n=1 Tax=viral metagenome TaxID=1070528 RepID=A0A6M3LTB8_9ZZZZ